MDISLVARLEALIDRLEAHQDSYFRWIMGTFLVIWATVIAVVPGALLTR